MIGFPAFLRALDRPDPHPWQVRLAERCAAGEPPATIAVPTGAGKTTTVEALVWALATQAHVPAAERTVGVRVVWAIDRRILVDEVHIRAQDIAQRLSAALVEPASPLHEIADRLAALSGTGVPLVATRWRGGIERPPARLSPLQPQVITSTVAQIGSRLLFRGYGVGEGSLAVEAGLAGCDTTICLDEAHLAEPFRQTVASIRARRDEASLAPSLPPLGVITLTATPHDDTDAIVLDNEDRAALGRRYTGPKRARLVEPDEGATATLVRETLAHLEAGAMTIACVVNTVRRAREVFTEIRATAGKDEVDVALLIGPQRPADRAALLDRHREVLFERADPQKPLVCVATQTFEVGLDADVEAMVTESASVTALVQRLGRLNRRGDREGRATIVRDSGSWLYGDDEEAAWDWLRARVEADGSVDVSVAALDGGDPPPPQRPVRAPELTPEIVELLCQTSPRPGRWQEPDVEAFLRGADAAPAADVMVCWRADLRPEAVGADGDGYRELLLKAAPPHAQELLTLSVPAARGLIAARYPGARRAGPAARVAEADADLEVEPPSGVIPDGEATLMVPFVVLRRGEVLRGGFDAAHDDVVAPRALGPGDVVVLPTVAGGCDAHGLAPGERVGTHADDVAPDVRPGESVAPVRITQDAVRAALGGALSHGTWVSVRSVCASFDVPRPAGGLVARLLEKVPDHPGLARLTDEALAAEKRHVVLRSIGPTDPEHVPVYRPGEDDEEAPPDEGDDEEGKTGEDAVVDPAVVEQGWVLVPVRDRERDRDDRGAGDDERALPTLEAHADAVHDRLKGYLGRLGLAAELRAALLVAARAHDHGKADPRFQAFIHRGIRPIGAEPLAKSEFGTDDLAAARIARRIAGLPTGLRHEIASVAVLAHAIEHGDDASLGEIEDVDLALHLVGSHHGRGRPLPPMPRLRPDTAPSRRFHVDAAGIAGAALGDGCDGWRSGAWLRRFMTINARYGAWGAAYLEALLVLADRNVSAEGG